MITPFRDDEDQSDLRQRMAHEERKSAMIYGLYFLTWFTVLGSGLVWIFWAVQHSK